MRKLLILLLIVILTAGLAITLSSGIQLGNFHIASIEQVINENDNMDKKIEEVDAVIKNDYAAATTSLDSSLRRLQASKQNYQDKITYSTEEEIKAATETERYKIEYLWTKIGLYATKNNVIMQANVTTGDMQVNNKYYLCTISFTAIGEYINISEFIYAIENDTKLGFKIEDFSMTKYSETELQATFAIRNVAIDKDSLIAAGILSNTQPEQ